MKLSLLLPLCTTLLLTTLTNAHANSPCKGLTDKACHSNESCRWIESYTTQRGTSVKAYCRSQAKKRSKTTPPAPTLNNETIPQSSETTPNS